MDRSLPRFDNAHINKQKPNVESPESASKRTGS